MAPSFTGGALSFKGDKKKAKKKKTEGAKHSLKQSSKDTTTDIVQKSEVNENAKATLTSSVEESLMATMTDAERKAYRRKKERERIELEQVAKKSHRERVDEFNEKLSQLTEHNDLPRVSAAGNG